MPAIEQAMAGDRIAFAFTALIMIAIFAVIVVAVRDTKKEPSAAERANALRLPTKADDHIAVDLAMNQQPYFVHSTDSIREVAQILATNKTSGVPVVDEHMKVVGFISDGDIMKYIGRSEGAVLDATLMLYRATDNENFMQRVSELLDLNVMRIATKGAISVESGSELDEACRLLAEKRIKKAPVVSEDGTLVGSLSRSDVIRSTMANLAAIEALAKGSKPANA